MSNNSEQRTTLNGDYVVVGAFAWNGDTTKLLFASGASGWENGNAGISIFILTIKNLNVQTILLNDKRLLLPFPYWKGNDLTYWAGENLLHIWSLNYMSVEYFSELALDVKSGNIIILTTPNPNLINSATPKP